MYSLFHSEVWFDSSFMHSYYEYFYHIQQVANLYRGISRSTKWGNISCHINVSYIQWVQRTRTSGRLPPFIYFLKDKIKSIQHVVCMIILFQQCFVISFCFQSHGIASVKNYNYKINLNWTSNNTLISRQKLFIDTTYSLNELVRKIRIRHLDADKHGKFSEILVLDEKAKWISENYHRSFGRCYTFYPDENMRNLGIYFMVLEL
jgi:hypothetical protein